MQFLKIFFVKIRPASGRLEVDAAHLHIEQIRLRGDDNVCAVDSKLLVNAVADSRGEARASR